MHTGSLHKLHNTGNKYPFSVTNSIYLNLFSANILIYQNRFVLINFHGSFQVIAKILFFRHNLHRSAAKHKAWADKHGIPDFFSSLNTGFYTGYRLPLWLRYLQYTKQFFKGITVFCTFYRITVCTNNLNATLSQWFCQVNGSLTAKRYNNSFRLFHFDNIHDIFHAQRLKVQLIRTGIISRYRFRVIIYDNSFIS